MRSREELAQILNGGNSEFDSDGFRKSLTRLVAGDETERAIVERVLDNRAKSAFIQQSYWPGQIGGDA